MRTLTLSLDDSKSITAVILTTNPLSVSRSRSESSQNRGTSNIIGTAGLILLVLSLVSTIGLGLNGSISGPDFNVSEQVSYDERTHSVGTQSLTNSIVSRGDSPNSLTVITQNGTDPNTVDSVGESEIAVLGTAADIDDDGQDEQPFMNSAGAIKTVEPSLAEPQSEAHTETTLVPLDATVTPRTSKSAMITGRFNGSDQAIFFTNANSDTIFRVNSAGKNTQVVEIGADALSAIGDIDGDNTNELVFAGSSQNLKYLEPGSDGTTESLSVTADSNNGIGIGVGQMMNVDEDPAEEVVFVSSNNINAIAAADGSTMSLTQTEPAAKAPITTADIDGDSRREIVFVSQTGGKIKFVDDVGDANEVRSLVNASAQPVTGSDQTGLV